MLKLSSST